MPKTDNIIDSAFEQGFKEGYNHAINKILKDIKSSSSISVQSIEKYLEELIKK